LNFDIGKFRARYQTELFDSVIPFWIDHAIDEKYGGFFTSLDRDGSVYDTEKYMWMQWRVVYSFATLVTNDKLCQSCPVGNKEKWLSIAKNGFEFLYQKGRDQYGNYYFALNQKGEPIISPYNIYSEAFAVMGSAALFKATGDEKYKVAALEAMGHYLARINCPKGVWTKTLPAAQPRLSLGHYMILVNLGMVLKETLKITDYDVEIDKAVEMVLRHFWNEEYQVLFENLNSNFTFDFESSDGRHLNPGHGLESMWFLLEYAEKSNHPELIPKICHIIKALLKFGWDTTYGGIYYFMDVLGKPHRELSWDMKLWWVHNEAMIATLKAYRITKDDDFLSWFIRLDEWSWQHFKDPEFPEWFAYLNRRGEPTHMLKGGKWKSFFHLPRYLWKCLEEFDLLTT
jgi:N-acylglucosamine 2-epimerase